MTAIFIVLLFLVANRLRGSSQESIYAYWGISVRGSGSPLGALVFSVICTTTFFQLYYDWKTTVFIFACCALFYKLGESFGWGKWIGQIDGGYPDRNNDEGKNIGIHQIANFIFDEYKYTKRYAATALFLRGCLWFTLAYAPLRAANAISVLDYTLLIVFFGLAFPLAFYTSHKMEADHYWERGETIYGLLQGILFCLILGIPLY